jgi:uncharacterized protein (DUF924 family)
VEFPERLAQDAGTSARRGRQIVGRRALQGSILREAYDYWIGPLPRHEYFPEDRAKIWFDISDTTDDHIRENFAPRLDEVATTGWPLADLTREEAVGLVIFLDQFPRNIFRESPAAFAYDSRAREVAGALLERNRALYHPCELVFLSLPFEHSEALADQDRSVRLLEEIVAATPGGNEFYPVALDFARKHRDLILRFHRFPHRNVVLNRTSTPEEETFLKEHGRGY